MFFQVFNPKHTGECTSLQVCSSLRVNPGGSSGPHVARRTRQGEKKSLAKVLEKQKTNCGQTAKAERPAAALSVEKQTPEKGKTTGNCNGCAENRTGRSCCWPRKPLGCAGLSREGQSSEHSQDTEQERCSCPPKKPLNRRFSH